MASLACLAWYKHGNGEPRYDFQLFYYAARCLRAGIDPYTAIGPGRAIEWFTPFYYPLPAVVALAPLAWLTLDAAHAVFVGAGTFLLGYAFAGQRQPWLFAMILSPAYIATVATGQWSILLLAAFYLPVVRALVGVKPNAGIAILCATKHRRELIAPIVGCAVLVAVSFVLRPHWLGEWRDVLRDTGGIYKAAVHYPGGILLLLAWLRWRRPEARYLGGLALMPQAPGLYTDLLLFAIPRSKWEVLGLAFLSGVALPVYYRVLPTAPLEAERIARYGVVSVPLLMLPCLVMVLLRPNEGATASWIELMVRRLPKWLRGTSGRVSDVHDSVKDA